MRSYSRLLAAVCLPFLLASCGEKPKPETNWFLVIIAFIAGAWIVGLICEHDHAKEEKQKAEKEKQKRQTDGIITSSTSAIQGRCVLKQLKFISVQAEEQDDAELELEFLTAVQAAGGNGVINMEVIRGADGTVINGDAVLLE